MTTPNHSDLQRDIGGLIVGAAAMEKRLDRLEKMIEDGFAELRKEIAQLRATENQGKGMLVAVQVAAAAVWSAIVLYVGHLWK